MEHVEAQFTGCEGVVIHTQSWLVQPARASVVVVHGLGEHGGRYAHVAQALAALGCAVHALDHRGHGRSGGPRAFVDRWDHVVADVDRFIDRVRQAAPAPPLFLLGHSMGGAIALASALGRPAPLSGLILSGPAVDLAGAPVLARSLGKLLSVLAPRLGMLAVDPSQVSRDPQTVADYVADPLNFHGKVPARTIGEMVRFAEALPPRLPGLRLPLLALHGGADRLAGPAGSRMVVERAGSQDKTLEVYEGLYHEIFNEPPDDRARVIGDLCAWVSRHIDAH